MTASIRLGAFELRCGADPATGDFILRTNWHRYRQQTGTLVTTGDSDTTAQGRPDTALLAQVHQAKQKAPGSVSEMANAIVNLSPRDLRKLRLSAVWEGLPSGWGISLGILSILAGMSLGLPVMFTVLAFIFDSPQGWQTFGAIWAAGLRALLVFVPLLLAVRSLAARWVRLPIANEYLMRRTWAKAFGTQD